VYQTTIVALNLEAFGLMRSQVSF